MRWSAARLRWVLLGGVVLLAAVVVGFFGVARWKAGQIWQRILARNGVNLRRETNGFTYSQSSGGRTVFTLHAAKATPEGPNRWALHDAVLILYGREPGRDDRISGKEIEYDQEQGVARAAGEVHMDLQVPEPGGKARQAGQRTTLGFTPENEGANGDPGLIHVRTSGLVYMRKLGLAATGEQAEFRYGGITCTSRGAEFDTSQSVVRLLADVHMTGTVRNAAFTLAAGRAELSRVANTVDLTAPVLSSAERGARAAHALLHVRKDGDLESVDAEGAVQLREGTRTVGAPHVTAAFGQDNRPQQARMLGGVVFADADQAAPAHGTAGTVDLRWGVDGLLQTAAAAGGVRFEEHGTTSQGGAVTRRMGAEQASADFAAGSGVTAKKAVMQRMHLVGTASFGSETQATAGKSAVRNAVSGDDLVATFAAAPDGRATVRRLDGTGHTRLEQTGADGGRQRSTGDTLEAEFGPGAPLPGGRGGDVSAAVTSAVQTGHVEVLSWPAAKAGEAPNQAANGGEPEQTTGHGDRAVFTAVENTVTLTGGGGDVKASVSQRQGDLAAQTIVVHQGSGDAEARGDVVATDLGGGSQTATHVVASRARLQHAADVSEFYGEAGRPAQLFQGGSQVRAGEILLDGKTHAMAARPMSAAERVEAVFATESSDDKAGSKRKADVSAAGRGSGAFGAAGADGVVGEDVTAAGRRAVRVSAARMDYDEEHQEAVFAGDVVMRGVMGEVRGERGAAFLKKPEAKTGLQAAATPGVPDLGGSLERMVVVGDVRLQQPGRSGVGEQLTYTAATDNIVLTGAPGRTPRVTGEGGSVVTGATLVFRSSDSTIVVAGAENGPKSPGGTRVHTETDLKHR